jgi:hypothetical protein
MGRQIVRQPTALASASATEKEVEMRANVARRKLKPAS